MGNYGFHETSCNVFIGSYLTFFRLLLLLNIFQRAFIYPRMLESILDLPKMKKKKNKLKDVLELQQHNKRLINTKHDRKKTSG